MNSNKNKDLNMRLLNGVISKKRVKEERKTTMNLSSILKNILGGKSINQKRKHKKIKNKVSSLPVPDPNPKKSDKHIKKLPK